MQEKDHYDWRNCRRQSPSEVSSSASHKIENSPYFIKLEESVLPSQQLTAEPDKPTPHIPFRLTEYPFNVVLPSIAWSSRRALSFRFLHQ